MGTDAVTDGAYFSGSGSLFAEKPKSGARSDESSRSVSAGFSAATALSRSIFFSFSNSEVSSVEEDFFTSVSFFGKTSGLCSGMEFSDTGTFVMICHYP